MLTPCYGAAAFRQLRLLTPGYSADEARALLLLLRCRFDADDFRHAPRIISLITRYSSR